MKILLQSTQFTFKSGRSEMAIKREKEIDGEIRKEKRHKILGNKNQEPRIRIYIYIYIYIYISIANKTYLFYCRLKRVYF